MLLEFFIFTLFDINFDFIRINVTRNVLCVYFATYFVLRKRSLNLAKFVKVNLDYGTINNLSF